MIKLFSVLRFFLLIVFSSVCSFSHAGSAGLVDDSYNSTSVSEGGQWLDTNCLLWSHVIYAVDDKQRGKELIFSFGVAERCSLAWSADIIGSTTNFSLQAYGAINGAHLVATNIALFDASTGQNLAADMDLVWVGTGELDRFMETGVFKTDDWRRLDLHKSIRREGTVSGRITVRTNPWLAAKIGEVVTLEIGPERVSYGDIGRVLENFKIITVPSHH